MKIRLFSSIPPYCILPFFSIILIISWSAGSEQTASERKSAKISDPCTIDRSRYGMSEGLPFWCELTDFERMAIINADKARQGEAEGLFALSIFASGNVRDMETYRKYHAMVLDFIAKVRDTLQKAPSPYEQGRLLYEKMCGHFFKHRFQSDEMKGYTFGQSQLSEIFRSGKYNCVSSALLYMALARYFGLIVKGVTLPSHIFVQLELPEGKNVEIETTVRAGFDITHDRKFYKRNSSWFGSRNLTQSSYDDYCHRVIIDPFMAVCLNMGNQHTEEKRMASQDRNRLREAMGYLAPGDTGCIKALLSTYHNEFADLFKCGYHDISARMFSVVMDRLPAIRAKWTSNPDILMLCSQVEFDYAHTLFLTGLMDQGMTMLTRLLDSVPLAWEVKQAYCLNILSTVNDAVRVLVKQDRFDDGVRILKAAEVFPTIRDSLSYSRCLFFNSWGARLFSKNSNTEALDRFSEALGYAKTEALRTMVLKNAAAARLNQSADLWKRNEWQTFIVQCTTALRLIDDRTLRQQARKNVSSAYYNWSNELSKKQDWVGAIEKNSSALPFSDTDEMKKQVTDQRSDIYTKWGNFLAAQNDFAGGRGKYVLGIKSTNNQQKIALVQKNLSILYARWALSRSEQGDTGQARSLIDECQKQCPDAAECLKVKERF